jgi:hypothetical protein
MDDRRQEYLDFRRNASGRLLGLGGVTPSKNNAFLMKIGEHLVVEFGQTGNACYVYQWKRLPAILHSQLDGRVHRPSIDIADLKRQDLGDRHYHRDSRDETWEEKFDRWVPVTERLRPDPVRTLPPPNPKDNAYTSSGALFSRLDFERHVSRFKLSVDDHQKKGGSLWVRVDNSDPKICYPLRAWGFVYKPGKGWWKE